MPESISAGGAITTDGTYIYAFHGNNSEELWRYDTDRTVWDHLTHAPSTVGWGGALTVARERIWAFRGNNTTEFWSLPLPVLLPSL